MESQELPPTEDLMREHGLLNRVLIVYEGILESSDMKRHLDDINQVATIIREFIEDYHEKL